MGGAWCRDLSIRSVLWRYQVGISLNSPLLGRKAYSLFQFGLFCLHRLICPKFCLIPERILSERINNTKEIGQKPEVLQNLILQKPNPGYNKRSNADLKWKFFSMFFFHAKLFWESKLTEKILKCF